MSNSWSSQAGTWSGREQGKQSRDINDVIRLFLSVAHMLSGTTVDNFAQCLQTLVVNVF